MVTEKKLRVIDANLLFFLGAVLFLTAGAFFQQRALLSGLVLTQLLIILAPPIIYLLIRRIKVKKALKFNPISLKHGVLVAMITLLMYPAAVVANAFLMFLLSLLGNIQVPQIPMPENAGEYVVMMLIVSLLAGFCEEVLFRGFVLSGYEPLGKKKAIIISSLLFGFFHFNIYNLAGPAVLGLVFGYLVILTDSIWAGIIGHMVNNGFAVSLSFLINFLTNTLNLDSAAPETPELSTTMALLMSMITIAVMALATGFLAYLLVRIIKKDREKVMNETIEMNKQEEDNHNDLEDKYLVQAREKTHPIEFFPLYLTVPLYVFFAGLQIIRIIQLG